MATEGAGVNVQQEGGLIDHRLPGAARQEYGPARGRSNPDGVAQLPLEFASRRRPQVPYWPTTPLTREQLAGAIRVAEQQDEAVLAIFRGTPGPLSPSQVWRIGEAGGRRWLLTSVRRSITNLTNANVLERAAGTHEGPYGRPEHRWCIRQARAA